MKRAGAAHGVLVALLSAVAVLCGAAASLRAHEIGTTRVAVTFPADGSYRIEVVTDAMSLLDKLEAVSGQPRSGEETAGELQHRLDSFAGLITRRVGIAFDGVAMEPRLQVEVEGATGTGDVPGATLVLTGTRPPLARAFSWSFGWTFASYALRVQTGEGREPITQWIEGADASVPVSLTAVPEPVGRVELGLRYVALGFTHILPKGLDHVLFVLGLFLLSRRIRPMLLQISAFTIAHSITLGLSIYGLVAVPPSIVEPLIALSIAYIAVENLLLKELRPWRIGLVFAFGLLHGLGFAGALREIGLPRSQFVTALLGFNVGVELGQLAVVGAAFLAVGYWYAERTWYRRRIVLPVSACIACLGVFWTIQRVSL